ncbi:MAG: DUF3592 domain-containing protein [Planctomycetota bacterium]|jgi:hypothetical protein
MTRLLKAIAGVCLLLVFAALLVSLLFFMPAQFLVSSWRLYRADETTEGLLLDVDVVTGDSGQGTRVRYEYEVNGVKHVGTRLGPGLLDGQTTQTGGGRLAEKYRSSRNVTVHYYSSDPSFAFLEYGWPRWSIGFSLCVWGLIAARGTASGRGRASGPLLRCALVDALPWLGVAIVFFFPQYVAPSDLVHLVWLYPGLVVCHLVHGLYRRHRPKTPKPSAGPAAATPGGGLGNPESEEE